MLFINFLCLLYLMVLANSHTISKSIDSYEKADDNIFDSINDVDRPTIPKTRKDRQRQYKVYYNKDDDVGLQGIKDTKPYLELDKTTEKINVKTIGKSTTEHAKRHKSPKRRVGNFWKKLRGKYKTKESNKHDSKETKRRIFNHKKESHTIDYLTPKPDFQQTIGKRIHRKSLSLRKLEHNVSKRDASGLFSTRPYSNTPQGNKLEMGIAPQVDNMLIIKSGGKAVQQHGMAVATDGSTEVNLKAQLESLRSKLSKIKESYGLVGNKIKNTESAPDDYADPNNPSSANFQSHIATTEIHFEGTTYLDGNLSSMKKKAAKLMSFQTQQVSELVSNSEDAWHTDTPSGTPMAGLITVVSTNDIAREEKRTVAKTGSYELNPENSIISSNTESHSVAARSIKEDAMTIAMNVEDLLQKELKSLYNKVKHKVSSDFRKEVHTVKSTVKGGYEKLSSKLTSKSKSAKATTTSSHSTSNCPKAHSSTCPCKPTPTKIKGKLNTAPSTAPRPTTHTTAPRVKKKDEKKEDREDDSLTSETPFAKQTYDDYVMLTLYEQMLAKTHEDNIRKMLATQEFPLYVKTKREAGRLSKRNPETLTDVKLSEVVRNIYDDGGNMPDYDYIDPAANMSSTGMTTVTSNNDNYNDVDYNIGGSSGSVDYSAHGSMGPMQNKLKAKGTSPAPRGDNNGDADNAVVDAENAMAEADNIARNENSSDTSYEGLSNKISYDEFVNGFKHYLKFQQDLKNQNFSNLIKYQAHRHHSVDDIGKYILNKIPPLPTSNRKKRDLRFSDESDNNMDYQEITTKSDDSWFRKHFYFFIDNGPPKKYHTSETVELKPGTGDFKLFMTEPTEPTRGPEIKEKVFVRIDNSAPRKAKNTEEISLDDLSRVLDSIKEKGNMNPKAKPNTQKDTYMPMDTYNATDDVTMPDSIVGKFLGGKLRHISKRRPLTTVYFPPSHFMYADNTQVRLKRSNTRGNPEITSMSDFITKDNLEEKVATIGAKEFFTLNYNKNTNKYGYVDIDLVPRQTAIVKLGDSTKNSRFKNFFKIFDFKKTKTKKTKPKRSVYDYTYYSPNPRRERFNPIQKLKNIFKNKEVKSKEAVPPLANDYDVVTEHMDGYKPKFEKPISISEMQKQIPNISDIYYNPAGEKQTTKEKAAIFFKLDDKDRDLLYNYHPSTAKPSVTSGLKPVKQMANTESDNVPATKTRRPEAISSTVMATAMNKKPLSTPPSNVMTVNLKTMELAQTKTTLIPTETAPPLGIDDMSIILDKMQKELKKQQHFPTITTNPSIDLQTMKFEYKKNVPSPVRMPEELVINSKLTRFGKFPMIQRRHKKRNGDDSELEHVNKDRLDLGRLALQYIHDLESKNALPADKRAVDGNSLRKLPPRVTKLNEKDKSIYTDYFNDLLMWHNDILNLDTVPNSLWLNILKTLQTDAGNSFTTPDMRNLMVELNEMNSFLGDRLNNSTVTVFANGSMEVKAKDHIDARASYEKPLYDDIGMIRSMVMDDNAIVTSKNMLIKGEAKYFQYNKPKNPETLGSSDFIMKLNKLNKVGDEKEVKKAQFKRKDTRESPAPSDGPEPAIIVDTTLMAYDDDVDSITKELEVKKMSRDSQKSIKTAIKDKTDHTSVLKTNKAPVQYYTTPLPMKSHDFHKFLNDHEMGVDFVTAPIIELPTLIDSWTTQKNNKWLKPNLIIATTAETATIPDSWGIPFTVASAKDSKTSKVESKSTQSSTSIERDLSSTLDSIKDKVSKTFKFTTRPKSNPKANNSISNKKNKASGFSNDIDWNDDFHRYKRFNALKLSSTQEAKYYDIFKKKFKDKIFEKKVTEQQPVERSTTDPVSVDPQNKEVEITIINFDDIDKMTTRQPFDSFVISKKDEIRPFTDLSDMVTPETTLKAKAVIQKEDIHNGLLYKDIFKEQTRTTRLQEYSNTDLTKSTEYVDKLPLRDRQTVTSNKLRFPFDKVPVYPNIFNRLPHGKHFNNAPKRVHITSHHYKYDIFYDDNKKSWKNSGVEGTTQVSHIYFDRDKILPQAGSQDWNDMEIVKITDKALGNRHRRRVWRTEVPHQKRKFCTFRECKSKTTSGLSDPPEYFEIPTLTVSPDDAAESISTLVKDTNTEAMENTATGSLIANSVALADIEDVVTLLDKQDIGVTMSDIEDAVTLSAIQSEFFTSISVRDSARRALRKKTTAVPKTAVPVTTVTADTTVVTTKATTLAPTIVKSSPSSQPGSLVYDLKRLKTTTSTSKLSKDKKKVPTGPQRERHRRLFKFSLLQNRLKSFMKNFTMAPKLTNVTKLVVTTRSTVKDPKSKSKRTCFKYIHEPPSTGPEATENEVNETEVTEMVSDEREGFVITLRCNEKPICSPSVTPKQHTEAAVPASAHSPPPCPASPAVPVDHHYEDDTLLTYQDEHQHAPPTSNHRHHHHHGSHHHDKGNVICQHKKPFPKEHQEILYVEPHTYDEQSYYEEGPMKIPPSTPPPCEEDEDEPTPHCDYKREILHPNTFTAKDVAALEVIVDLMKNTMNYEDNNIANGFRHSIIQPFATKPVNSNSTNSIQVHIAIPYDFQTGKKRSPSVPGPVRVRKVFSAKMSTPVDLEYQVHSIEATLAATSKTGACNFTDRLTPGMYLLIDKPRDGFAIRPVLGQLNLSELKSRQLPSGITVSMTEPKPMDSREETTSMKNLARVTLSKDFVAAINQQLLEMYENKSRVNKDVLNYNNVRLTRSVWRSRMLKEKKERKRRKKVVEKYAVRRRIDWEAVKKYFGHDRVCNCKCKSNTAMCRACAASDAVIDELIFEFDNIGKYMADHCTEIQTFFWMNPIGGQKLRDSVNKIDRSLTDYYKRVKGKCQGRLCKTFSTYVDKRTLVKTSKIKKEGDVDQLVIDLGTLADDLNHTLALNICYSDKLKENGDKFVDLMYRCIRPKSFHKRSDHTTTPLKMVKQVYSLDNINVNIICNPESAASQDEQNMVNTVTSQNSLSSDHLFDFDLDESRNKKHKGLKLKLFPHKKKKSKLLSYFDFNKSTKTHFKRQIDNQVPTPLISDGGGSFWYDYLKSGTGEPRLPRDSIIDAPTIKVDVVQREVTAKNVLNLATIASTDEIVENSKYMIVRTSPERNPRDVETTTDSLSRNINQMLQLFGSLQDVEAINNSSSLEQTTSLSTETALIKGDEKAENKPKKLSFAGKVKQKLDKTLTKTMITTQSTITKKYSPKMKSTFEKAMEDLRTLEHTIESVTELLASVNPTTDESNVNTAVISSGKTCNVTTTCTPTTNKSSVTVGLAAKAAETPEAAATTVCLKGIASHGGKNSKSTPAAKEITTKFGLKNIMKVATVMFRLDQTSKTSEKTTASPAPTTTELSTELSTELTPIQTSIIDLVTENQDSDYVIDENSQNVTQNPTILIINDYGNHVSNYSMNDDMKESFKNLLLSIIQFETNNLNDEWDRVAYGKTRHREEADVKRSITKAPKVETTATTTVTPDTTAAKLALADVGTFLASEPDKTTMEPEGLLNKIASKIGIKVVNNKKKVVKKPNLWDLRKDRKRASHIKNRKLRINSYRPETPAPTVKKEACNTRRTTQTPQICDIQATFNHIQSLQKSTPPKIFEILMKNVSCYKHRNADAYFVIPYQKRGRTWDWIRNRRSLKHFYNRIKGDRDDETYVVDFGDDPDDFFETYVKGDNGIYKIVKRKKRKANLETLERGLKNIPTLVPTEDELFVMLGDSVTLDCGLDSPVKTCDGQFLWQTDRKRMLSLENVETDGATVTIHNVEPRNSGTYTCSLDHAVRKTVKLNVLTVPSFDVVFLPVYKTEYNCSYDDLIAIQRLNSLMSNETRCGKACSVRIDEPVCQRDRGTNNTLVRATAIISMTPSEVNCSLQCKRDIVSSLVMMCATNAAVLSSIPVLISKNGISENLMPWKNLIRPVVTHTLRKKDTNGHHEYHQLSSHMSPGKVDVVLICPAGFYLLPKYKLCSSCPPNTSSKAGDNTCRSCPRGTRAEPGASKCHLVKTHQRRYDWWWYPPCGYVVAGCGVLFGCSACVLLSVIVHVVSRDAELREQAGSGEQKIVPKSMPSVTVGYAHIPGTRPLSPSRVILPRFFRPSLTSSRATDSQETKFELWKERNRPPPLPPIDFDP